MQIKSTFTMPEQITDDGLRIKINDILVFTNGQHSDIIIVTKIPDTSTVFLDLMSDRDGCYYFSEKLIPYANLTLGLLREMFPNYTVIKAPIGSVLTIEVVR